MLNGEMWVPDEIRFLRMVSEGRENWKLPLSLSHSPPPASWPQLVLASKGELRACHLSAPLKLHFPHSSDKVLDFCPLLALTSASALPCLCLKTEAGILTQ